MWAILAGFPGTPEGSYLTNINSTANQCWRLVARTDSSQMQRVFRIVVTPSVSIGRLDGVVVSRGGGNLQVITAWGGTSFGSVAGQFFDSSGTAIGVSIPFCTNTNGSQCDWTYTAEQVPAGATRLEVTASSVDSEGDVGAKTTSFSVEM